MRFLNNRFEIGIFAAIFMLLAACGSEEGDKHAGSERNEGTTVTETDQTGVEDGVEFNTVSDDIEFLHQLGQVRGHLAAFITLYRQGEVEMAATHAKHPESELYTQLIPAFESRNMPGFADELSGLVEAIVKDGDVEAAHAAALSAIEQNEPDISVASTLKSLAALVRTAGDEFLIGVALDGTITNAHEYQDAYGFIIAAQEILSKIMGSNANENAALEVTDQQLNIALNEFGDLTAARSDGKANFIYSVAARIDLTALELKSAEER